MGFNETFIKWVQTFYKNPKSRVRVNGHCSNFFPLGRGTRQGEVLSPSLFALSIEPLAELIRSNPQIQGIRDDSNIQHKLSLFADDILLFLENPLTSVPALLNSLNYYSMISGYKINTNKSEALMLVGTWPLQLNNLVSFRHSKQGFRYLGVILTPKTTQLFSSNYDKLLKEIRSDLNRWDVLPLSLLGRIECIRMNLLPRLLFLFQNLPVDIPQSTFKFLDKIMSKFIWQNKRPRVRLKILMSPKENGGLNMPDLKLYYWAAQIKAVVAWIIHDPESHWVPMEEYSVSGVPLSQLPFLNQQSQKKIKIVNLWVKHTLKIWNKVQKQLKGKTALSRAMTIYKNIEFIPSLSDSSGFRGWAERGLISVNQLFEGNVFKTFDQLKVKFKLPSNDLYKYLQIRSYVTKHNDWELIRREPTNIEKHFINLIENGGVMKKQMSLMYKKMLTDMSDNTQYVKQQWEMELNVILDDDVWSNICSGCHKGVGSQVWREFDWKTKIRFFRTPLKSFLTKCSMSDKCWRNCGLIGDQTHIFWDCPNIYGFWKDVKGILEDLLKVNISFDSQTFLLDIFPDNLSQDQSFLLHLLLMMARKMITICWLKPEPPTIAQWTQKIRKVYLMERLTAHVQLKTPAFERRWGPIMDFLK